MVIHLLRALSIPYIVLLHRKVVNMPAKAKKSDKKPWEVEFVSIELTELEKSHLKTQAWKPDEVMSELDRLADDGYKVSLWKDKFNDCAGCTITCNAEGHSNHRKCITGRGPDFIGAIASVLYKHYTLCEGDWSKRERQGGSDNAWG